MIPPHAAVTMRIIDMRRVVDYLKTPRVDKVGTQSWPLRNLRTIFFDFNDITLNSRLAYDFAQIRKDIAFIMAYAIGPAGLKAYGWDEASSTFI